ncbi:hypothetical protein [Streptomyces niveus]|uniref:hypothetical protein n=1 Tax=Streptomyces niveus TaxID=193462 RepID=UPI001F19AC8E|nr:hypothetical protein [Streptomyces niveus]
MNYRAKNVNLVPARKGTVMVVDGKPTNIVRVDSTPTLHRFVDETTSRQARLERQVDSGIQAYAFTFG